MSSACRICLEEVGGDEKYHARCARRLFGTPTIPTLDIETSKLHTAALAMIGHASLSGVQKKISVNLSVDRKTLQVATDGGRYILKPQTQTYPSLPENEHTTTRLAQLVDIEVAPFGLVPLKDGSMAYIVKRFDRLPSGRKVRQEDFCQLAEFSPKQKYEGSAELCVRLLRKYASEPPIEILKLFRLLVFAWWSGNGDLHLKNLSLLIDDQGIIRLTPAYDLVCTSLVIPEDQLALPIGGKKDNLHHKDWLRFAEYCQLPEKAASRLLQEQRNAHAGAVAIIENSFLPLEQKQQFTQLLTDRSKQILN